MKKPVILLVFLSVAFACQAQLAQTKWKGIVLAPDARPAILQFGADSLNIFLAEDAAPLEAMSYQLKQDTLLITKLAGRSPCDAKTIGRYLWKMTGNSLQVVPVTDDCAARLAAWPKEPFERAKE